MFETSRVSDSLLTQVLLLLEQLNANVEDFKIKLSKVERDMNDLKHAVDAIIHQGFVNGDLLSHQGWHQRSWFRRLISGK